MQKISDVQREIDQLRGKRQKLAGELQQVRDREEKAIKQAGADLLDGKDGKVDAALTQTRDRKAILESALSQLDEKIGQSEQELHELQIGESAQAWQNYEASFWVWLAETEKAIGAAGLNAQAAQKRDELTQAMAAYHQAISAEPERYGRINSFLTAFSHSLFDVWKHLENMRAVDPNTPSRPGSTGENISGFGRLL